MKPIVLALSAGALITGSALARLQPVPAAEPAAGFAAGTPADIAAAATALSPYTAGALVPGNSSHEPPPVSP